MTEAQKRAQANYRKKCKKVTIDFFPTEEDIYAYYDSQPQKRTWLKNLIREDMMKNGTSAGEILPCPVCKTLPRIVCSRDSETVMFGVECQTEGCTAKAGTLFFPSIHDAAKAWNERITGEVQA